MREHGSMTRTEVQELLQVSQAKMIFAQHIPDFHYSRGEKPT